MNMLYAVTAVTAKENAAVYIRDNYPDLMEEGNKCLDALMEEIKTMAIGAKTDFNIVQEAMNCFSLSARQARMSCQEEVTSGEIVMAIVRARFFNEWLKELNCH